MSQIEVKMSDIRIGRDDIEIDSADGYLLYNIGVSVDDEDCSEEFVAAAKVTLSEMHSDCLTTEESIRANIATLRAELEEACGFLEETEKERRKLAAVLGWE